MITKKKNCIYTNKRKYVQGSGVVNDIGSTILENKDLMAKPLLGAVGNIGAMALTEGSKILLNKLVHSSTKDNKIMSKAKPELSKKSMQIIEKLKRGSGIKKF